MSLKEKIADWYLSSHKIEDCLGNNPYLETTCLGKAQNILSGVPVKTAVLSSGLAHVFNAAVYGGISNLEFAAGTITFGGLLALHHKWEYKASNQHQYYVDTSPDYKPALPSDKNIIRHLANEYITYHPHRCAITAFPIISAVSGFAWTVDQPEAIPHTIAGTAAMVMLYSRKYWKARQILNENWQLYTDLPEQQPQRDKQRGYVNSPSPSLSY